MRGVALAQEVKELDAFPQPAFHHLRAANHLADDCGDLAGAEIESPVKLLDGIEYFRMREMRIVQRRDLHAFIIDEFGMRLIEPAIFAQRPP